MVTRKEMDSWWRALTWSRRGLVHKVIVPVPMEPPVMALIFRGCSRDCVVKLSFIMVLCSTSMKLSVSLESIKAERTETTPE